MEPGLALRAALYLTHREHRARADALVALAEEMLACAGVHDADPRAALKDGRYTCFLEAAQALPMMYMPDCVRGTVELIEAAPEKLKPMTENAARTSGSAARMASALALSQMRSMRSCSSSAGSAAASSCSRRCSDSRSAAESVRPAAARAARASCRARDWQQAQAGMAPAPAAGPGPAQHGHVVRVQEPVHREQRLGAALLDAHFEIAQHLFGLRLCHTMTQQHWNLDEREQEGQRQEYPQLRRQPATEIELMAQYLVERRKREEAEARVIAAINALNHQ